MIHVTCREESNDEWWKAGSRRSSHAAEPPSDAAGGRTATTSLVIFGMRPEHLHPPPLAKNQERRRCGARPKPALASPSRAGRSRATKSQQGPLRGAEVAGNRGAETTRPAWCTRRGSPHDSHVLLLLGSMLSASADAQRSRQWVGRRYERRIADGDCSPATDVLGAAVPARRMTAPLLRPAPTRARALGSLALIARCCRTQPADAHGGNEGHPWRARRPCVLR